MNQNREQVRTALAKANAVRYERSAIRHRIHTAGSYDKGRRLLAQLLSSPIPEGLHSLPARELLGWIAHMPKSRVDRMLRVVGASERITTGRLTTRQCYELARLLRGDATTLREAEQDEEYARWARSG